MDTAEPHTARKSRVCIVIIDPIELSKAKNISLIEALNIAQFPEKMFMLHLGDRILYI